MAITFIEPKRRKYYLILLLIVVVIGVLFLIWNFFFLKAPAPSVKPTPPPEIKINFEILGDSFLINSQSFEEPNLPGAKDVSLTPTLSWQSVPGAEIYLWEIIGVESGQTEQTSVTISKKLNPSTTYTWRVSACKKDMSECSVRRSGTFTTVAGLPIPELVSPPVGETFLGRDNPFIPYSEIKPTEYILRLF
jgi:hypothetical protein